MSSSLCREILRAWLRGIQPALVVASIGIVAGALGCSSASEAPEDIAAGGNVDAYTELETAEHASWYTLSGMFPRPDAPIFQETLPGDARETRQLLKRGRYLVEDVAQCGYCHMNPDSTSLSGGRVLVDETGRAPVPNITPDVESGIGAWSIDDIVNAIRSDIRPDATPLSREVHKGYRYLANRDARAIAAYIKQLPAVSGTKHDPEARDYGVFPRRKSRRGYTPMFQESGATTELGRYLVHAVAGCQRCHSAEGESPFAEDALRGSQRFEEGSSFAALSSMLLRGNEVGLKKEVPSELLSTAAPAGVESAVADEKGESSIHAPEVLVLPPGAPNIRGREGLVHWSKHDIQQYLLTGLTPGGKRISNDDCPWEGYRKMSKPHLSAIVRYLSSL